MKIIPPFTGFYTSQVVQDFFHQQYVCDYVSISDWKKIGMNIFSTIWTYRHTRSFPQGQMLNVFIFSWDLILQTVQRSGGWMRSLSGTDWEQWNELLNWLAKKRPGISRDWHGIASSEILTESMYHPSWKTGCLLFSINVTPKNQPLTVA